MIGTPRSLSPPHSRRDRRLPIPKKTQVIKQRQGIQRQDGNKKQKSRSHRSSSNIGPKVSPQGGALTGPLIRRFSGSGKTLSAKPPEEPDTLRNATLTVGTSASPTLNAPHVHARSWRNRRNYRSHQHRLVTVLAHALASLDATALAPRRVKARLNRCLDRRSSPLLN